MEIRVEDLCKSYSGKPVLADLNMVLLQGNSYCLMAPSGYGKTTLLHIMMGLETPDSGVITGLEGFKLAPVFQEDRLCENLSASSNIRLTERSPLSSKQIEECLEALGLSGCQHKPVREFSGGMKRRVAIARALLSKGDVLIMDEPFRGLDLACKEQVMDYVRETVEEKTLIWVTHDEEESKRMDGQLIYLENISSRRIT